MINIIDMARISCGDLRFTSKNRNKSTTAQINKWIEEMVSLYGTQIDYFVYDYRLERHDQLLGEDRPAPFLPPVSMTAIVNVNNDNLMLTKFGLQTQSDIVCYIPYKTYGSAMNNNLARPKAGDLIRLTELGMDRPLGPYGYPYYGTFCTPGGETSASSGSGSDENCTGKNNCTEQDEECGQTIDIDSLICCTDPNKNTGDDTYADAMSALSAWNLSGMAPFGPNIYEITTVKDEDIAGNLNPMMGHYVWKIEAIRFDNSYQPDAPVENGSNMVNDAPYYGKLPGGSNTPEANKLYPQTTDKEEDTYWDHDKYKLDQVYGGYGYKPKEELESNITYDPQKDPYSPKYWVVFDSLPFYDLATVQVGDLKYYLLTVEKSEMKLTESETALTGAKARYYIKDTSPCINPTYMHVYAVSVFNAGIAVQFVGDVTTVDDTIYSSIFIKNKGAEPDGSDAVARLWINKGVLTLTEKVTQDNPTGKTEEDEEDKNKTDGDTTTEEYDPSTAFPEETTNPVDKVVNENEPNQEIPENESLLDDLFGHSF